MSIRNPKPGLKLVVVIPCLAEAGIMDTIESLQRNREFISKTECLIVINHSESACVEIKTINQELFNQLHCFQSTNEKLQFYPIETFNLPDRRAGVGMARRIGMDLAVARFKEAGTYKEGVIICLDGDCTVQENYLAEIERYFSKSKANGCSIYFEHPLDGENREAIIDYELFLRYYNNALRWCGFPFAFQTVGSSMAVSAVAYEKQGGMNTRKAGEDFYFLNKIIQLERFGDLTTTTVYPSSRKSERVPFGTGREMMEWKKNKYLLAYNPDMFIELKKIFGLAYSLRDCDNPIDLLKENEIHSTFISYFEKHQIKEAVMEARSNTKTAAAFNKRFFVWMNAFRIMKLLNELSASSFPMVPINDCANWLWKTVTQREGDRHDSKTILFHFRRFDRVSKKEIS